MLPVALLRGRGFGAGVLVWAALVSGCGPAAPPAAPMPAPTPPTATAAELQNATAAAEKALSDGRIEDAMLLARFVAEREASGAGQELLGRVLLVRGTQAEQANDQAAALEARTAAAAAYRRAADANPTNAALQDAAGVVIDMLGDRFTAVDYYSRAIEREPTNPAYLLHRGNAYLRDRRVRLASRDASALLKLAPDEAWSNAFFAEMLIAELTASKAIPYAERARALAPKDLTFRVLHARALRANEQVADGVELLMALPEAERGTQMVAAELAQGWLSLKRPKSAAEAWELAYRTAPNHEKLACAIAAGEIRLKAGDRAEAKSWLDVAALLAPDDERVAKLARAFESTARTP